MEDRNYVMTNETIRYEGHTLHRITCIKAFGYVVEGELGGYIESYDNLSDNGWVSDNAKVYENAKVFGDAQVYGNAEVFGDAQVYGNARLFDNAEVFGNACVYGNAMVGGYACVFDNAMVSGNVFVNGEVKVMGDAKISAQKDYIVFKNWWSSGRWFTWTRSNNMWKVGCFYGTGKELIEKAYSDSEESGREYETVVRYAERIMNEGN